MLYGLSELAIYINQIQGREKERERTDYYQINKLSLEIHVFSNSFFKLRVSFIDPCHSHDYMTAE